MPFINIRYLVDKDEFQHDTDLKEEKVPEVVGEFLRTQMGLGKDSWHISEIR